MTKKGTAAVVLAGGRGKRMNSSVNKQYMELGGKPLIYYALQAFEQSLVERVVLVVPEGDEAYCRREIVDKYNLNKVTDIVAGGAERYLSVYEGLCALDKCDYVFIHDGARPFVTPAVIERAWDTVCEYQACVVGMPVKDTIKVADEEGFTKYTPDRKSVWITQTPQVFEYGLIRRAYEQMFTIGEENVTDDAMVLERVLGQKAKWVEGSYYNIKVTTPEDLLVADVFLHKMQTDCCMVK